MPSAQAIRCHRRPGRNPDAAGSRVSGLVVLAGGRCVVVRPGVVVRRGLVIGSGLLVGVLGAVRADVLFDIFQVGVLRVLGVLVVVRFDQPDGVRLVDV